MGRKRFTRSVEQLEPDCRYNSKLVSKFINCLMWDGKKSIATSAFYEALDILGKQIKDKPPQEVFETAVNNVKPNIEVRSRRVGGSNYQVPMQVTRRRQQSLAIRWIISAIRDARGKSGKTTAVVLAQELSSAYRGEGAAVTAKVNVHRMADANKAFAHFAW